MLSRRLRGWARGVLAVSVVAACLAVPDGTGTAAPAAGTSSTALTDWPAWSHDLIGTRYAVGETAITPSNVGNLKLKWAFAYPNVPNKTAKSQPAVVAGVAYFGSPDGKVYAVDAKTGATIWRFDVNTVSPGVGDISVGSGPTVTNGKVFFGDHRGYVYAVAQGSGALLWATRVDSHPFASITGSPLYYGGKVYIGMSSQENSNPNTYPCCTFRGQVAALDAGTGAVVWRHYTVPPASAVGTWPNGVTMYAPSGGSVWGVPMIDPTSGTLYVGTGQNYTGVGANHNESVGDIDSLLALNTSTGAVRWKRQFVPNDVYRLSCGAGDPGYCPALLNGSNHDWDVSSGPNLFAVNKRLVVGVGHKNGVYHVVDAATGAIVWERTLGQAVPSGGAGIQWGTSFDGRRLYVATWQANPGTLFALDPATGNTVWATPNPADGCTTGGAAQYQSMCQLAFTPAVSSSPGVVYEGSWDGKLRAFSASTGAVLWQYDTLRPFTGVNGVTGSGSALSGNGGVTVSDGMVFVQSGYYPYPVNTGYVLLAFGL